MTTQEGNQGVIDSVFLDNWTPQGPNYPMGESPSHTVEHMRVFVYDRLRPAREAANLSLEQVAEALHELAHATEEDWYDDPRIVALWEDGTIPVPAWAIFAFASVYHVSTEQFVECFTCRAAMYQQQREAAMRAGHSDAVRP